MNAKYMLQFKKWYVNNQSKYGNNNLKSFGINGTILLWNYLIARKSKIPALIDCISQVPCEPYHVWARICQFFLGYYCYEFRTIDDRFTMNAYANYIQKLNGFDFKIQKINDKIKLDSDLLPTSYSQYIPTGGAWYEQFSRLLQFILCTTYRPYRAQFAIRNWNRLIQAMLRNPYTENERKRALHNAKIVLEQSLVCKI